MTTELRLILLALSLVLLAGIWWWGARKSSQAPGLFRNCASRPSPGRRRAAITLIEEDHCVIDDSDSALGTPAAFTRLGRVAVRALEYPHHRI